MESYKLVLPGHLNHYGYLFGGNLLKWIDEVSWIAASRQYPACKFVTAGMDRVEFRKSVKEGTILRFWVERVREGKTSVQYLVDVFADELETGQENSIFATHVTFVCLDRAGNKRPLGDVS